MNVPSAAIWSKLANLVCQYHLSQSMRKATFQLHFYFYDDILIVVNISVYKTFFIPLSLEILNHLSLYFLSTFLITSKGFCVFRRYRKGTLVWNGLRPTLFQTICYFDTNTSAKKGHNIICAKSHSIVELKLIFSHFSLFNSLKTAGNPCLMHLTSVKRRHCGKSG